MSDGDLILSGLVRLLQEVDTPEMREICSEDEWIRHQRQIYKRVRRGLDCDITVASLLTMAIEDQKESAK